mmetsp:Transcript_7646/g.14277  ORF Transcript_7646/g.14277 Transcript_7646/m.14277 type:complete len:296 (+) Transcript_7646:125-1012(+)
MKAATAVERLQALERRCQTNLPLAAFQMAELSMAGRKGSPQTRFATKPLPPHPFRAGEGQVCRSSSSSTTLSSRLATSSCCRRNRSLQWVLPCWSLCSLSCISSRWESAQSKLSCLPLSLPCRRSAASKPLTLTSSPPNSRCRCIKRDCCCWLCSSRARNSRNRSSATANESAACWHSGKNFAALSAWSALSACKLTSSAFKANSCFFKFRRVTLTCTSISVRSSLSPSSSCRSFFASQSSRSTSLRWFRRTVPLSSSSVRFRPMFSSKASIWFRFSMSSNSSFATTSSLVIVSL